MGSAVVGCAKDWSTPKPTILFELRKVLGKEKVRSKVNLEDEQEVDGKNGTKSKQTGQGKSGSQSGCGWVTGLWEGLELGRSVGVKSRPGLEENDFLLDQWGVWEGG